ncbi:MAG: hypothetical protein IPN33_04465 [Saprospiraceae bacterium]|nr:hypothetical protein [Saprospiraceae bacterium]
MAREVLYAINEAQLEHVWENEKVWESYYLSAKQAFGEDHEYVMLAKKVFMPCGKLPQEVKIHLERLMRDGNPNVIISTTTLAQGVNLGLYCHYW